MPSSLDAPPSEIELDEFVLRRYQVEDASALAAAVSENLEHLRPWMPWIALEPTTLKDRVKLFAQWDRDWSEGVQYSYGMFRETRVVGGAGLMRRIATDGLEIGYWVHAEFVGRGFATRAAGVLTTLGLSLSGVSHIEIHHDKANVASGRVPQKLGFDMVGEQPAKAEAPGNTGVNLIWRMDLSRWTGSPTQRPPSM
jgi:ribosomal-protein-serine acetyltransferase